MTDDKNRSSTVRPLLDRLLDFANEGVTHTEDIKLRREAVARIEALERELSACKKDAAWVPVTERLPESCDHVLVHGGIAYYRAQEEQWFTITGERWPGKPIQWPVRHWMPLPEPPK